MSTKHDILFRNEVARVLASAIERAGVSKAEAARELQVSRQALYKYLDAKTTPRSAVLSRACRAWGVKFRYKDGQFGEAALHPPVVAPKAAAAAVQMSLFAATEALETANFEVFEVRRKKNGVIDLRLRIKLAG